MASKTKNGTTGTPTGNLPVPLQGQLVPVPAQDNEVAAAFKGALTTPLDPTALKIPRVTIDHRAGTLRLMGEPIEYVEGYPVWHFDPLGYWEQGWAPGKHDPPDCFSEDIRLNRPSPLSANKQADTCSACPWFQFKSAAVGKGKACKQRIFWFLVNQQLEPIPLLCVIASASSIKIVHGSPYTDGYRDKASYFKDPHTGRQARYGELVWTRIGLQRASETTCVLDPQPIRVCPNKEQAIELAQIRDKWQPAMEAVRGQAAHIEGSEE